MIYFALIITVFIFYFRSKKAVDKRILLNEMTVIYEKMEITVLNNNIQLNNNIVSFLESHKNMVVNPEFADIKIIMAFAKDKKKNAKNKSKIQLNDIPEPLMELSQNFKEAFVGVVKLSMLRWSFIRICLICGTFLLFDYFFHFGTRFYRRANVHLSKVMTPNPYVSSILTGQNQDEITNLVFAS